MWTTKRAPYLYQKRGWWYFSRRVPADLKGHYRCSRITFSLKTRSLKAAKTRAMSLAGSLEQDWMSLRWRSDRDPFNRYLVDQVDVSGASSNAPTLSEAKSLYVEAKQAGRPISFQQTVDRVCAAVTN